MKKKNPLIISDKEKPMQEDSWNKKEFYRELVIKKYDPAKNNQITWLSDVLPELPSGIVYKDETGMGATTLELKSERNSIIVEPIKITASSKAFKHDALYVGSPTENYHPNKTEDEKILSYIQDANVTYKKIIVVADSLRRVINSILDAEALKIVNPMIQETTEQLNSIKGLSSKSRSTALKNLNKLKQPYTLKKYHNKTTLNKYFLLIDEIDSFQLDSSYRRSMEDCLDYYKIFRSENRCMLSATDIRFSDPELQNEPITFIRYNKPTKRDIDIITSGGRQLQGKAFDRIVEKIKKYPNDKILVAYNTVNGCFNLAENLIQKGILNKDEIAILCSVQSKDKVDEYFKEMDSDLLPKKLNFITSAYFTGFDLHEQFHLISISGNKSNTQALSERRLKQIAGRCRPGTLSETIIHDIAIGGIFRGSKKKKEEKENITAKKVVKKDPTKEELIKAATEQVNSLVCMNKHYRKNKLLHEILEDVNDKFMKLLDEKQMRYVRRDKDKNVKISYLNIDAKLESLRVKKELYLFDDALTLKLKMDGHNVTTKERFKATEIIESKVAQHGKDVQVRQIIEKLKGVQTLYEIDMCLEGNEFDRFQKSIVKNFKKFYGYLDQVDILNKMEKCLISKRDNRKYNALLISAQVQTLPEGHIIIDRLKYYFEVGKRYTQLEILQRMRLFFIETGNSKSIKDPREAIKILNYFRKKYRKPDKETGRIYYHMQNDNPHKIKSISKRQPLEKFDPLSLKGFSYT